MKQFENKDLNLVFFLPSKKPVPADSAGTRSYLLLSIIIQGPTAPSLQKSVLLYELRMEPYRKIMTSRVVHGLGLFPDLD